MKKFFVCFVLLSFPLFGEIQQENQRDIHSIRGGRVTPGDKYYFAIQLDFSDGGTCSGTLIAPTWILTAAHCFGSEPRSVFPNEIDAAKIGEDDDDTQELAKGIKRVIMHPEYSSNGGYAPFVNDAALIELTSAYDLAPDSAQVLNQQSESRYAPSGTTATLLGVGRDYRVYEVEMPLYLGTDCHEVFDPALSRFGEENAKASMHEGTICAGIVGDPSKGVEGGDSGGSVLVPISRSLQGKTTWGLAGIISHSMSNESGEKYAVISTRISSIYGWIQNTIQSRLILTHVFAGPLSNSFAKTEITLTNLSSEECSVEVLFHQGVQDAPSIRFNGKHQSGNLFPISLKAGSAQKITLTIDSGKPLAIGAVYVTQGSGCSGLHVSGRYLVTRKDGQIMETFSVLPQSSEDWLGNGSCVVLAGDFRQEDNGRENVGLAMVTSVPGQEAPEGTRLVFEAFDWDGNPVGNMDFLEVTGEQYALNPWEFDAPRLIRVCLDAPQDNGFQLSLIAIAATATSKNVQYSASPLFRP